MADLEILDHTCGVHNSPKAALQAQIVYEQPTSTLSTTSS
jgi:hypothetical protein